MAGGRAVAGLPRRQVGTRAAHPRRHRCRPRPALRRGRHPAHPRDAADLAFRPPAGHPLAARAHGGAAASNPGGTPPPAGARRRHKSKAHRLFVRELGGGRAATRVELAATLAAAGISPEGQRLPHLLLSGELEGLLTSGPRRGGQFTWALLEERAPGAPRMPREEALAELARRYFRSRGPAQLRDFTWWSGLTMADARIGIALRRERARTSCHR